MAKKGGNKTKKLLKNKLFLFGLAIGIAGIVIFAIYSFGATCTVGNSKYCPTVKYGSKGVPVVVLQMELTHATCIMPLEPDGVFGSKTLSVVKTYQKQEGLKVDGIVGPKTWAHLDYDYDHPPVNCD